MKFKIKFFTRLSQNILKLNIISEQGKKDYKCKKQWMFVEKLNFPDMTEL